MSGEKGIEVLYRGNWRKFVPAQDRRSYLFSWHTRLHRGYAHMLKAAEDMNITWPNISDDIREYLGDCGCGMYKNNRRKSRKCGTPKAILPEETSYTLDLHTDIPLDFASSDKYWCLEVHEKMLRLFLPCWRCGPNLLVLSYTSSHFLLTGEESLKNSLLM